MHLNCLHPSYGGLVYRGYLQFHIEQAKWEGGLLEI